MNTKNLSLFIFLRLFTLLRVHTIPQYFRGNVKNNSNLEVFLSIIIVVDMYNFVVIIIFIGSLSRQVGAN